jgi:hypothetical protein
VTDEAGLFRKIAEVMGEVGYVEKRGRNTFHNYDYVTEADLVDAVRGKLAERKVALIPSVESIAERTYQAKGKESVVTTVTVAFTFLDGETGATFKASWSGQGDDTADKGLYKAYTGALKYFLMKTFLVPTGDDPESDSKTDERAADRTISDASSFRPRPVAAPQPQDKSDPLGNDEMFAVEMAGYMRQLGLNEPQPFREFMASQGVELPSDLRAKDTRLGVLKGLTLEKALEITDALKQRMAQKEQAA